MTRSKRTMTAAVLALVMLVCLAAPALALGAIDTTHTGSIKLLVQDPSFAADLKAEDITTTVNVYKLASVNENGAFELTEKFMSLKDEKGWNNGSFTQLTEEGQQDVIALWEAATKLVGSVTQPMTSMEAEALPEVTPDPEQTVIEPDYVAENVALNGEGTIDLTPEDPELREKLGLGLYLIVPEGVQTVHWVYTFGSSLLSVPMINRTSENPPDGEWNYDVSVAMKAVREYRLTEFEIVKHLPDYNETVDPVTFVFDVTATIDGKTVYSNVVSLTFDGPGTQSTIVSGIPVGAHVTVTEVYTGASYEVEENPLEIEYLHLRDVEIEGMDRVEFTNHYEGHRAPDPSIENTFVYDGTGWQWKKSEEAEG